MAYTPDKAFDDMDEVGQKAFLLYAFYCKHGSMNNNVVSVGLDRAAAFLDVVYENACRLSAKLKKAGWIQHKNGKVILVKGFEHLVKTDENNSLSTSKTDKNVSSKPQKLTKTTVSEMPSKPKTDENNSQKLTKTTVAYKEEPASFNQQEISQESNDSFDTAKPILTTGKKSKNEKLSKNPKSQHIAIQTIRGLMKRYPDEILWDKIIAKFGTDFSKEQLSACREAWIERGYNPQATTWLNWYFDGIPEQIRQNGAQNGNGNGHDSKTSTTKQIESGERLQAIISDGSRFKPPQLN